MTRALRRAGTPAPRPESAPVAAPERRPRPAAAGASLRALLASRVNTSPRWLVEPGPRPEQLERLFAAAAAAPDHGRLTPWRFVIVPTDKRPLLAAVFARALMDRDPGATLEQIESARDKAYRAPLLMLAILVGPEGEGAAIPAAERLLSLGCAVQNLLLAAHSMGYGSGLTSGQAMASTPLRGLFGLQAHESAVCFVNLGSVARRQPGRSRPPPAQFVTSL